MSGDHNMYASGSGDGQRSGWRKRQVLEMAREAGLFTHKEVQPELKQFEALVRADEREKFLGALRQLHDSYSLASDSNGLKQRGQA